MIVTVATVAILLALLALLAWINRPRPPAPCVSCLACQWAFESHDLDALVSAYLDHRALSHPEHGGGGVVNCPRHLDRDEVAALYDIPARLLGPKRRP